MCFVWIWEQTAIISLYSINWLVILHFAIPSTCHPMILVIIRVVSCTERKHSDLMAWLHIFLNMFTWDVGRDSSVGIATRNGLGGPGIESRWGEIFRTRQDRPWGPPSLLYFECRDFFPGVKRPGRGVKHPPASSTEVKERVEQYLYSHSGLSWPVLGWTRLLWNIVTVGQQQSSELPYEHFATSNILYSVTRPFTCAITTGPLYLSCISLRYQAFILVWHACDFLAQCFLLQGWCLFTLHVARPVYVFHLHVFC
jgi:hypothetical protein